MGLPAEAAVRPVRVLIVDDQHAMRSVLRHALRSSGEFDVVGEASDGEEGLDKARWLRPDIVLVDLGMPVLDGVGMIRRLRERGGGARIVVLTGQGDRDSIARAIEAGADSYVLKGCPGRELRDALRAVLEGGAVLTPRVARSVLEDYTALVEEKRRRDLAVIRTLATTIERRDHVTGDHANNVARLSLALWRQMIGSDPPDDLVYGFLLHDVGKIAIPDAILLKQGALTEGEQALMRTHVEAGVEIVSPLGFKDVVLDVIRCHHERWDGAGYPAGLRGEAIPFHARAFSVVDAYDAMTSDRPYHRAMPPEHALEELERGAGTQFDPACADGFARLARDLGLVS